MEASSPSQVSEIYEGFRATVDVAGHTFTATDTFNRCKEAEQFVSKLEFGSLSTQPPPAVLSTSFLEGSKLCKSILYEYSVKEQVSLPFYKTGVPVGGPATGFVSKVTFGNSTFVGPVSKSKKEAEQNVARVVINHLLENTESRRLMSDVIRKVIPVKAASAETSFLEGSKLCKMILYEYSVEKGQVGLPFYETGVPDSGPTTVFVSKVTFDSTTFVSPISKSKKEAEQNAALVAINHLLGNTESRHLISQVIRKIAPVAAASAETNPNQNPNPNPIVDPSSSPPSHVQPVTNAEDVMKMNFPVPPNFWSVQSKPILKEYGDKKGCLDKPLYSICVPESGPASLFVSSLSFEGNLYWGPPSKSKKEAEQAAAHAAINTILGDPVSRRLMLEVIQSKISCRPFSGVNLISNPNPTPTPDPNPVNFHLDQVSTNPETNQIGEGSCISTGSPPLVNCGVGPTGSELGQSGGMKVENLSGAGPSKLSQKRARKKEREREAKKVKTVC